VDWRERSSCRFEDPDLFFPVGSLNNSATLLQIAEAKAVCRHCPVLGKCLDVALEADRLEGVWGGTTESERRIMRRGLVLEAARSGKTAR
jgi:WhiB family redox-sensing transcriptional regulator